jgi:hypothetical protein
MNKGWAQEYPRISDGPKLHTKRHIRIARNLIS